MKKVLFLIIFIIKIFLLDAFTQKWASLFHFNAINGSITITKIINDSLNNFYVTGLFNGTFQNYTTKGQTDLFLAKINVNGNLLWFKQIGSKKVDGFSRICYKNNRIYFIGSLQDTAYIGENDTLKGLTSSYRDLVYLVFSNNGNLLIKKRLAYSNNNGNIDANSIDIDNDNNIILTGAYQNSVNIGSYVFTATSMTNNFIAKINSQGDIIWAKDIRGNASTNRFWDCKAFDDGYYFTGYFRGNLTFDIKTITSTVSNQDDIFVYKTDFNGNGLWIRKSYGSKHDRAGSIVSDNYGNVYVTGFFTSNVFNVDSTNNLVSVSKLLNNSNNNDIFIIKYNKTGNLIWLKSYGSNNEEYAVDINEKNDLIFISGYYTTNLILGDDTLKSNFNNDRNIFTAIFDLNGNVIKADYINGSDANEDRGDALCVDANNNIFIGAYFKSANLYVGNDTLSNDNTTYYDGALIKYTPPFKAIFTKVKNPTCFGMNNGELVVTTYFGIPPYNYQWSHDPNLKDSIAKNLSAGSYSVTVTDGQGRQSIAKITLNQPPMLVASAVISNVKCFNGSDGSINVTISGGTLPYTYRWESIEGSGVVTDAEDQTSLTKGKYVLFTTDKNLCSRADTFLISEPPQIIFAGSIVSHITDPPGNNGAIDLNVSGGVPIYLYNWTGPDGFSSNDQDILNLSTPGIYSVRVTDNNNCKRDTSFAVKDETKLIVYISAKKDVDCKGNSTGGARVKVENGSGDYTYKWRDNLGYPVGGNIDTLINVPGGTYFIKVIDNIKIDSAETYVVINEPNALNITLLSQNLRCADDNSGFIDLRVSGGTLPYSFSWSNGKLTEDLINIPAGNYYVTVTDANNCIITGSKEVTQPNPITINFTIDKPLYCYGDNDGIITCHASGGYGQLSYFWNDPGNQTTPTATALAAGTYTCTVIDENNCTREGSIQLLQPLEIRVTHTIFNPTCNGYVDGKIINNVVGGTPPFYYSWSTGVTLKDLENIGAGNYSLTVTDYYNCKKIVEYNVTEPSPLLITDIEKTDALCYGSDGNVIIYANGGNGNYSYSIDGGLNYYNTSNINAKAGNYQAIVRDYKGCLSEKLEFSILQPSKVTINEINITYPTCYGYNNGIIQISASGGIGNYEYSINGGSDFVQNNTFVDITNSIYSILVKDGNNCLSDDSTVIIDKPEKLSIYSLEKQDISCYGNRDGFVKIVSSGGTGNVSYSIDGGNEFSSQNEFVSLEKGTYTIVLRDENNCLSDDFIVDITEPQELVIESILTSTPKCYGYNDGSIIINAKGGTGPLQYSIDGGQNFISTNIFNVGEGNYIVKVKDNNNCFQGDTLITITQPSPVIVDTIRVKNEDNAGKGEIELSAVGGTSPYLFVLISENNDSISSDNKVFTNLLAGHYVSYVIDNNNCKSNEIEIELKFNGTRDIIIYDAFSPNGDGINDVWNIGNIEYYPDCNVIIYNTWGVKVFSSKGYKIPWDGTYKGAYLPAGTYYYVIDLGNGKKYTGPVNIVR